MRLRSWWVGRVQRWCWRTVDRVKGLPLRGRGTQSTRAPLFEGGLCLAAGESAGLGNPIFAGYPAFEAFKIIVDPSDF